MFKTGDDYYHIYKKIMITMKTFLRISMIIREAFKTPSYGKSPLRGYPPGLHGPDFSEKLTQNLTEKGGTSVKFGIDFTGLNNFRWKWKWNFECMPLFWKAFSVCNWQSKLKDASFLFCLQMDISEVVFFDEF